MTSKRTPGEVLFHLTVPQEHQKNLFSITHGIPTIVVGGGAGLSGFQAITSSLHAVTMDTRNGTCAEHCIAISRNRATPEMTPTRTKAYDLTPIREEYSRIFLVLNCAPMADLPQAKYVSFKIESTHGEVLLDETYDVSEAGDSKALVLAVLDRTEKGWSVGPVGAIQHQYNFVWVQKVLPVLGEHWSVGLPNPLSDGWKQLPITQESFSHLVAHAVDSELKTTYQQGLTDLGPYFTQIHATDLLCELVYQWAGKKLSENRISVARDLVERGADWCDILFGEGLEDERCIAALLQMASVQPSWATFFLDQFEPSQLLAFATTEERADALYALIPATYLLDRVCDGVRVRALEHDLGL